MDDFDHDACYYRILGDGAGYCYRTGEPEEIAGGSTAYDHPFYEFDDLESVGQWLFLGDRVLVLRVPRGALVEMNRPMSQGGCMTYSASRIERVGLLSLAGLMRTYEAAGVRPFNLHLAGPTFDDDLRLPAGGVDSVNLDHCRGRVDLSVVSDRISLWASPLEVLAWPVALAELRISDGHLRGPAPSARSLSLEHVTLDDVVLPPGVEQLSLFQCTGRLDLSAVRGQLWLTRSDLEIAGVPPRAESLHATDCRFIGISALPAAPGAVRDCTFA